MTDECFATGGNVIDLRAAPDRRHVLDLAGGVVMTVGGAASAGVALMMPQTEIGLPLLLMGGLLALIGMTVVLVKDL